MVNFTRQIKRERRIVMASGNQDLGAGLASTVSARRSIRDYRPEPIERGEILEILALAGRAPSAWNLQPWRFVAVVEPETRAALQGAAFGQPQVGRAPAVIVVYSDMVDALGRLDDMLPAGEAAREKTRSNILNYFASLNSAQRDAWGRGQANIALGYLLLVLESRGYGSSPMLGFDPARVKALLGLPDHVEVAALVAFGQPAEEGRPSLRHDVGSLVQFA
jgi:nitroreductase